MSPEQHLVVDACLALIGGCVGYLIAQHVFLKKCQEYYEWYVDCEEELDGTEDLLEDFRVASQTIVRSLEKVGEETDWADGPETSRRYEWHEIEPLVKCLERQRKREEEIASTPSS